jgi:ubiquitin-activating enzyme E1
VTASANLIAYSLSIK